MGSGTKRAADNSTSIISCRGSKVQKTDNSSGSKNNRKKATTTTRPPLSTMEFKSKALPLHVNLTHMPPSLKKVESDSDSELVKVDIVGDDIGFIENLTLLPSSFATGSYGWKGNKRIIIELQGGGGDDEGYKEEVQVMLSINATVIGSKPGGKTNSKHNLRANEDLAEEPEADENDDE